MNNRFDSLNCFHALAKGDILEIGLSRARRVHCTSGRLGDQQRCQDCRGSSQHPGMRFPRLQEESAGRGSVWSYASHLRMVEGIRKVGCQNNDATFSH